MKLLITLMTIVSMNVNATCLSDSELETVNSLSPDQALEFMVNVEQLKADKTCSIAEGIDFDTIKENIESIVKGDN